MKIDQNILLAPYTSFQVGGPAQYFALVNSTDSLLDVITNCNERPIWLLGYGSNTLISDQGLPGLTIVLRGGDIEVKDTLIVADAGVWWDDVVQAAINHELWGVECLSQVPGSLGAAIFINITAYGQSIGPLLQWVEVWDPELQAVRKIDRSEMTWDYKISIFQKPEHRDLIILRAAIRVSHTKTQELQYQKALDVAEELRLNVDNLSARREIIIEARKRAGSLWTPDYSNTTKTVGSFFRNPMVSESQSEFIMNFDESGKTKEEVAKMNIIHGGSRKRVSAAHVMLAAGYKRGQSWTHVKLNDQNLLKLEALDGATAQELYDVAQEIIQTCQKKLGITLEPEARILGSFD